MTTEEHPPLTVGQLREILANHPDDMKLVLDSDSEQSCAHYLRHATVITVQEVDPDDENTEDVPGDVGQPHWLQGDTPEFDTLWLTQWDWRW